MLSALSLSLSLVSLSRYTTHSTSRVLFVVFGAVVELRRVVVDDRAHLSWLLTSLRVFTRSVLAHGGGETDAIFLFDPRSGAWYSP